MNINLNTLALLLGLLSLIGQVWELVLMGKRKEYLLLVLSIVLLGLSTVFEAFFIGVLFIKLFFYSRYWSDKSIRKVLYLQLIPIVLSMVIIGVVYKMASSL